MLVENVTIDEFTQSVKTSERKIVLYGVGVIGQITAPQFLAEQSLSGHVLFFVDADKRKQEEKVRVEGREIQVFPPDILMQTQEEFIILITVSRYETILSCLKNQPFWEKINVYVLPQMLAKAAETLPKYYDIKRSSRQLIPKQIHYCWFGCNEMPDNLKKCVASWQEYCPDYDIMRWDETMYDVGQYIYTKQAYELGKWAFVSDVARLDILYQYGGIYLDTDVELLKNLDDLLYQPAFCGVEKWRFANTGGGCGSIPGHPMIAKMLELRKKTGMLYVDGTVNMETNGFYESMPLVEAGFLPNNKVQVVEGMTIYSSDFFNPYDYMTKRLCITENTYSIHHFSEGWISSL